eukprot:UN01176
MDMICGKVPIIFYYSGHGGVMQDDPFNQQIVCVDGECISLRSYFINSPFIRQNLKICILDCCRGILFHSIYGIKPVPRVTKGSDPPEMGCVLITASKPGK